MAEIVVELLLRVGITGVELSNSRVHPSMMAQGVVRLQLTSLDGVRTFQRL
jgi:hypothetical protein